ncbi:MAG: two-component system sensor histidine kinase PhoQ [Phenylobacterium sp.]|jgi:two-component system sensor histidine kinase PhoQ
MNLSLKSRQILIFVTIIVVVLPTLFLSIEQAFKKSQVKALEQQLEANLYAVISEIDLDAEEVDISSAVLPPLFSQVGSDSEALIEQYGQVIWRSDSALNTKVQASSKTPEPGQPLFYFENHYWHHTYALFFDNEFGTRNLVIHIRQHESILNAQLNEFRQTTILWFIGIDTLLVLALAFGLWSTLAPINKLDIQIKRVEKGLSPVIDGQFPKELTRVKEDINLLISQQERQKNRYRSSLSDLTHALKTPVAVLKSSSVADDEMVTEQLDRMTNIIEHQLRKASSGGEDVWKKKVQVAPVVEKLLSVMAKIYQQKEILFIRELADDAFFYGDEADLMEISGNLIDNASKAATLQVRVSAKATGTNGKALLLTIEDDGPGVKPEQREKLLIRGQRLDTYEDGHGVGLAIVNDLVNSYDAALQIMDSPLGGAKFVVDFAAKEP